MISHYHRLAAIYLVSLLILRVSPSPVSSVSNVNLDVGSSHHTVTSNADCDKAVGNPFDILPSYLTQVTDNSNSNVEFKPLALFGDEDVQIGSEIKDTYDIGLYSAVCWSRIVTTIVDENGRLISNFTEYAISFETPGDIPDKYLAQYSIEEHNNKYVKKSVQVPIVNERKSGDNTVKEEKYVTCSSGPFYSRTLIKYKNNKKKLEIRVSPESHKNVDKSTENKSVIDEICEDQEDDEKTTAIKEELLWQILRDILGKNEQTDMSGKNLTELINERRSELIAKIEEIMPDNANKTDSILDETVQKIKRDEFQSSNTKTLTSGSKIYSSQWGTSTNSESTELESADTSSVNESTENLSYNTFIIRVTEFVSHRRGVILDEIMQHMKVSCYEISEHILESDCPAQLDIVPTIDSTKLPSSVTYTYKRDIPESVKQNSFFVTDPLRNVCYHLRKVRKVECPQDTTDLVNLRIVTYARNMQATATATENPSYMTVFPTKIERTFTIKVTEFVSHRRGVILDEIMRHMKVSCYDISEKILETDCPAQLDIVPTMDSTKLPSFVSYNYKRDIPESVKRNSFLVTDPLRKACYHLVKVRKVECPSDTSNLLNLRIVTYAGKSQSNNLNPGATNGEVHSSSVASHSQNQAKYINSVDVVDDINKKKVELAHTSAFAAQADKTFTIKVTEFVSHRRGVILDEIMRHMKVSCYDISEKILETDCPAQLDIVPTMDSTKLPSFVSYNYKRDIPESVKRNSFLVTDPLRKACYHLVKVRKVECPSDTSNLLNLRIVTYAGKSQSNNLNPGATNGEVHSSSVVSHSQNQAKYIDSADVVDDINKKKVELAHTSAFAAQPDRTFMIKVTEFVSHRRGVILDEIMRHMKVSCYDISEKILETDCPAQLDIVPTMDSTKLPSFVSYNYKRDIAESVKRNSFLVTDPLRKACYHLVKVRKVECPSDTSNVLNLRIVTYERHLQATTTENPTYMTVFPTKIERTFTIKVTEFVSHRRGVILDEIMRHMKVSCYHISETILKTDCPAQLDIVPTMDSTKLPSFVSYNYKRDIPESVKQNSFLVTDPLRKACYHLVKVRKVECPSDTNNLLNLRIVTYAGNSQNQAKYIDSEEVVEDINKEKLESEWHLTKYVDSNNIVHCFKENANSLIRTTCPEDTANLQFVSLTQGRSFLARYIDNGGRTHCVYVYEHLKPTSCPSDAMTLPVVQPINERPLLVKFLDKQNNVHCYLQYPNRLEHTSCSNDYSIFPEISMKNQIYLAQYVDFYKNRFCFEVHDDFIKKVSCPSETLPFLQLSNEQSFIGKVEIGNGIEFCYIVYPNYWKPTSCPDDTSDIPVIFSSSSDLYIGKITDKANQDFCYFVYKNSLKPAPCPLDTSNLPSVDLVNGKSYTGRIVDANNKEHCYTVFEDSMVPVACPEDTSGLPYITLANNLEYIGKMKTAENGMQCFVISKNIMKVVTCPEDLSTIPTVQTTDQIGYLAKYEDFMGQIKCVIVYKNSIKKSICPVDTSNLPLAPMPNIVDKQVKKDHPERKIEEKIIKEELAEEISEDIRNELGDIPIKKELLEEVVEDIVKEKLEPEWYFTKYIDSNNIVYCFKENGNSLNRTTCPEDTANLQFVSLTQGRSFLARYIDNEGRTHCVHVQNHLLKPTSCPSDALNLPVVQPTNERPLLVKFLDKQNNVHCYLQYPNRLEHTSCSNDYSIFPGISMKNQIYLAQYVDFYKNRFCFEVHDDFIKKVSCPSETLPFLQLSNEQSFIGKVEIGNGIEFCYIVYPNYWKPTSCPDDTSDIPVIFSSSSDLYIGKITDKANQDFCYFVYKNSLKPAPCPLDTSNLPSVDLVNGKSYTGRIVDANNKEHCYTVFEDSMVPVDCPEDTSGLPYITIANNLEYIGKMETAENGMQCFVISKNIMNVVTCPEDLSTIPFVQTTDQIGYLAKYEDLMGQIKCVIVYKNSIKKSICPIDTSNLPLAPMPNIVDKQVKKDHPERKIEEKVIKEELAEEISENIGNELGDLPIKKELLEEVVEDIEKEKLKPEWYFTKYIDSNNIIYCFKENGNSLNRTTCPEDTANLQFVSLTQGRSFLARYIDNEGRTHCVHVQDHLLKPTSCPSDALNLPVVQPTNERPLLVKFLDKQNNVHCYLQYPNRLEHTSCSNDYSIFPGISMKNQIYLAQYVDFYKNRFCFEVHNDFIKKVSCPSETLPFLQLSNEQSFIGKVEIGNGIEFCYIVHSNYWKPTSCPDDTSNVPVIFSSSSDLYIGKITDKANQDFCYFVYKNSLKPAPCPLDTSNLPSVDLVNGKSYIGRIVDANSKEHCYTVFEDSMVPVACPEDTSGLPYITIANNLEYIGKMKTAENGMQCFVISKNIMNVVTCPEDLSTIPFVQTTDQIGYLAKYEDFMGQVKCVIVYKNSIKKTICPVDTSNLPLAPVPNIVDKQVKKDHTVRKIEEKIIKEELAEEISEDIRNELGDIPIKKELLEEVVEDIVKEKLEPEWYFTKYIDSNNIVYCFKENGNSLNRTTCPKDTSNLRFVSLTQGRSFLARYIDNEGRTHCVHVYNQILKPTSCPSDVMNLPIVQPTDEKTLLVKFLDKQKNVQCYLQYSNRLEHTSCSNEYSTLHQHDEMGYLAKYVDSLGQVKCFVVYKNFMKNTVCPVDTSLLPLASMSNSVEWYGKYVTAQGDTICLKIQGDTRNPVPCPDDVHWLPTVESVLPHSVTLRRKEIRELIKVMCKGKFYNHFQKNNNSVALQKLRQFLP